MGTFQRATKRQARLRLGISAPSGGGKSYSGLLIATELAQGGKIAAIDTERGSLSKYSNQFEFDVLELESYEPATYVKAIQAAEREGYSVILIDSLSHAWIGRGGALEMVDNAATRNRGENRFTAWREVTPQHNALVEAMLQSKCHLIATMRAKTEYVMEEYTDKHGNKKTKPVKVGLAPVQRDGMEYEFDVMCDMDVDHNMMVSKTRCPELDGKIFNKPGADVGRILLDWLTDGAPMTERPAPTPAPTNGTQQPDDMDEKKGLLEKCQKIESELGLNGFTKKSMKDAGYTSLTKCPVSALTAVHGELTSRYVAAQKTVEADAPFDMDAPEPADEQQPEPADVATTDDAPEW